ncbi:integral membrane protein [Colletotrichum tofieldiae]|nr:integral membrane protein [Colletotrichum tofieldiae]
MEPLVSRNEEGERMSDIARELPQVPVGDFSRAIQVIAYVMSSLSTLVIALRVYERLKLSESRKVWGWDDTFAVAGWIPLWPSVAFLIIATRWGLGAHDAQIPERGLIYYQIKVKEDMFYFEVIYFASSVLTKLAMAIMIVRLSSTRVYSYIIWGNMAVLGINTTVCMVIMLVGCHPIPALWNEKLGYCRIPNGWMLVSYAGSVILAMVDWTCAITPFFMIRSLQMPKRRKISLQAVLSFGVIGSAAGLVRMGYYHSYDTTKHPNESLCKHCSLHLLPFQTSS